MHFNDMTDLDIKIALQIGSSIRIDNIEIAPYTLSEIEELGYSRYIQNIQWVSLTVDDFINSIVDDSKRDLLKEKMEDVLPFDFYIKLGGKEMQDELISVLGTILRTDDLVVLDDSVIAVGFIKQGVISYDEHGDMVIDEDKLELIEEDDMKMIHRENFNDIVKVIKLHNYLEKPDSDKEEAEPADESAKSLLEEMKKMREKVEEAKRRNKEDDEDDDIDMSDIISAVSSKSNSINRLNIKDHTLYQIYDEYARLELIDNYDFSIKAIMAGAKDIDMRHWSSRL